MLTETYIYLISDGSGYYKIGESMRPKGRLQELQTANARKLSLIAVSDPSPIAHHVEHRLQWEFRDKCVRGEWFKLDEADAYDIAMRL